MKQIISLKTIGLTIGLCIILTACNDWLDVQPKSQVEDSELFSTETGFKEALSGVYSSMVNEATYTKEMLYGTIAILGQEWTNYPSANYQDMVDYNYSAAYPTSIIANIWKNNYNSIANVNNIINQIDGKEGLFSYNNFSIIKGEALALRAFLHFDLLRCFGVSFAQNPDMPAIPYCTELTYRVFPQLTVRQVADKIKEDLTAAKSLLKADPIYTGEEITEMVDNGYLINRQVHLNYYAVTGLLARFYMWVGDYGLARSEAQEVVDSQLFPWATDANLRTGADRSFVTEQLFALNNLTMSNLSELYFNSESNTTSFSLSLENLMNYYNNNTADYRYLYLFQSGTTGDLADYRYLTKYNVSASDETYYTNKMPLIRISEMYLILAECDYRTTGDGTNRLKELREARGVTNDIQVSDFYDELIKEYRREFLGEGQLFFLYKRLNYAAIVGSDADAIGEKVYTFPLPISETEMAQRNDNR